MRNVTYCPRPTRAGIQDMLERVCTGKKIKYAEWSEKLKEDNRWHVEVY